MPYTQSMQIIRIYKDSGVGSLSYKALVFALQQCSIHQHFRIEPVDSIALALPDWLENTHTIMFPGGRDIPYHESLKGAANQNISLFIQNGGNYFGICAGAYYGSASIEFEKGGGMEVIAGRELKFFPGAAIGPAYGNGKFCYEDESGSQLASLITNSKKLSVYYNGGCFFKNPEMFSHVKVLAKYADIYEQPAAVVLCQVGRGKVLLSGVHPEYSGNHDLLKKLIPAHFEELKTQESVRQSFFRELLQHLDISS